MIHILLLEDQVDMNDQKQYEITIKYLNNVYVCFY